MRLWKIGMAGAIVVLAMSTAHASEPSAGCEGGEVSSGTTPAGLGADLRGAPPGPTTVVVCNTGQQAPPPGKGAVTVWVDPTTQKGYVDIDGDSNNTVEGATECTDGFDRVAIDSTGPHFYDAPDGKYDDTNPSQAGNQKAAERAPADFFGDQQANCGP